MNVAPRVGAWIETIELMSNIVAELTSRPAWARGLKLYLLADLTLDLRRAPRGRGG